KEQLNKRKPDDEFAYINLGYLRNGGDLVTVYCPESKDSAATQNPDRTQVADEPKDAKSPTVVPKSVEAAAAAAVTTTRVEEKEPALFESRREAKERHYRIHYGATGYSFESIFGN